MGCKNDPPPAQPEGVAASFNRSAMVIPSKKSSIILSKRSHMGFAWQHSVREQAAAPWLVQETALKLPSDSFKMLPTV